VAYEHYVLLGCVAEISHFFIVYIPLETVRSSGAEINFYRTKRRYILEQWNPQLGAFRLIVTSRVANSDASKAQII